MHLGARDYITKNKVKKRKRFLRDTVDNLYQKYISEGLPKISRTTFYQLKPFRVVSKTVSARDTCMCKTHTNMAYLIHKLAQLNIISSRSSSTFINSEVCNTFNKDCFFGVCPLCKNKNVSMIDNNFHTFYYKWVTRKVKILGATGSMYDVKITSKEQIRCMFQELINEVNNQLLPYLKHVYITDHQFKALQNIKDNVKENEAVVISDFSQNYLCKCK